MFPDIKLNNRYCHNPRPQDLCQNMSLTPKNTFLVTMMIMNTQETVIEIEWQEIVLISIRNCIVLKKVEFWYPKDVEVSQCYIFENRLIKLKRLNLMNKLLTFSES